MSPHAKAGYGSFGLLGVMMGARLGVAAAHAVAPRRGRQTTILALCLLFALFGLESAIHSVHHLSDPQSAASCALYSAFQHAPGAVAAAADAGAPTWAVEPATPPDIERVRPLQAFRPHEGRAPPASRSV
jgi:hypothetical protein